MSWLLFAQLVYLLGVILWIVSSLAGLNMRARDGHDWGVSFPALLARAFGWPLLVLWHITIGWRW